jgi:hypothetical protein
MADRVFEAFLARQLEEGQALARESDLVSLAPLDREGSAYLAEFRCTGLVEEEPGRVVPAHRFHVGIRFPSTYLRMAQPFRVLQWVGPRNVWHPNIAFGPPFICIGRLAPGTGLVDILYQVYEVITWQKVTMREDDALNAAACQWARRHLDALPLDRRPLKRHARPDYIGDVTPRSTSDGATV